MKSEFENCRKPSGTASSTPISRTPEFETKDLVSFMAVGATVDHNCDLASLWSGLVDASDISGAEDAVMRILVRENAALYDIPETEVVDGVAFHVAAWPFDKFLRQPHVDVVAAELPGPAPRVSSVTQASRICAFCERHFDSLRSIKPPSSAT